MSQSPPPSAASRFAPVAAPPAPHRDVRRWALVGLGTVAVVGAGLLVARWLLGATFEDLRPELDGVSLSGPVVLFDWLVSPKTYVAIAAILVLERLFPARPSQPLWSRGFLQDVLYALFDIGIWLAIADLYLQLLDHAVDGPLGFLRVPVASTWPFWLLAVVAYLLGDFLGWLHHLVRHKVPLFWRFHAVHHSQTELNQFTDLRAHPVDVLVARTILFLPFFVLGGVYRFDVHLLSVGLGAFTRFYHANLRTDLGWLRYVLVTPQSHRVHHSVDREHYDTNFGIVLSVWDRIFRTQHDAAPGEYVETGIPDRHFPTETVGPRRGPLRIYVAQLAYPFRRTVPAPAEVGDGAVP